MIVNATCSRTINDLNLIASGTNKKLDGNRKDIQKKLKSIENLALTDLKTAYCECLKFQIACIMDEDEAYFRQYALFVCVFVCFGK